MELHRFSAFDYMKLIVGSALVAAAFQFFTFPNSIVSGGVTGIAQIIHLLTRIPVGVLSILINIPIFCLGWRHRLGTRRLILALCVMAMISVFIDLLAITELVATDEPMLGAVYGGVINGAGGAAASPAGKWTSDHYDAYNRQHTTTDHHRCLLHHAAALCISADGAVDFFSNRQK